MVWYGSVCFGGRGEWIGVMCGGGGGGGAVWGYVVWLGIECGSGHGVRLEL